MNMWQIPSKKHQNVTSAFGMNDNNFLLAQNTYYKKIFLFVAAFDYGSRNLFSYYYLLTY